VCGCTNDSHCSSSQVCYLGDNKCVECVTDQHCSSNQVCYSIDNKCYSSALSLGQSCAADNGDELNTRCESGLCRNSDKVCVCTSDSHCSSTTMVSCMCVYSYLSLPCISTSPKLTLNTIMFEFFIFDSYYDLCFPSHIRSSYYLHRMNFQVISSVLCKNPAVHLALNCPRLSASQQLFHWGWITMISFK